MKFLKKLQEQGARRPLLRSLSPLVRVASIQDSANDGLNRLLSLLTGPLDDHFAQECEEVLTQYPLIDAPKKLLSIYSEMQSCVARLNAGMMVEPIKRSSASFTPDFMVRRDQKDVFILEVKTKFRPLEEVSHVLLETLIQSMKDEQKIKSILPPYHAGYYTLSCDCAASEKPLKILLESDFEVMENFIKSVFQDGIEKSSVDLKRCPKCQKFIRLVYDLNHLLAGTLLEGQNKELPKLKDLILKDFEKAKKQLETADPTNQLPHVVDVYVSLSNVSAGERALFPDPYRAFEASLRYEAAIRNLRLDLLTFPGWL